MLKSTINTVAFTAVLLLSGCAENGEIGFKNHPVDCAMGVAHSDCQPDTAGYVNSPTGQVTDVKSSMHDALERERAAWKVVNEQAKTACAAFHGDGKQSLALQNYQCHADIINKELLPKAIYPDAVYAYLQDIGNLEEQYYEGKIDHEQVKFKAQQSMLKYNQLRGERLTNDYERRVEDVQQQYQQRQQQQMEQQQQLQQSLQNLYTATSRPQPSVTTTNCHAYGSGNSVSCTTTGN